MEAEDWDARYAAGPGLQWGAEPNRWLVREVAALPPGTALDLGAGEGRNAIWLARQGWRVTAVDFSQVGLAAGLAPGGTLLVIGHDRTNLTDGYGGPPDPEVLFTAEDVLGDLTDERAAGRLRVERAERVDRPVDTAEGPRVARDALVRITRR